jgi:peptidyl-prolyl cis-trans isomerase D
MAPRKKGANILVWILMGFLLVGLAGFGIGSFGGSTRSLGSVGDVEITVDDYARAFDDLRRQAATQTGTPLPVAEAVQMGLGDQALARLVTTAALDDAAARIGLSAGPAALQQALRDAAAFAGPDGAFDRDAYLLWLDNRGMTAAEFEADLRADMARGLLIDAVAGGLQPRPAQTGLLLALIAETRDIVWAPVTPDLLDDPVPAPTDDQIAAFYDAHPERFTAPETRRVTYAALTPEAVIATMEADEAALRAAWAARADEFDIPERRLVERLVFPDVAAARAARDRLDAGETDFAALAAERGLDLADIDLGDVRRGELAPAAAEAVFGLAEPGIVGPVDSTLGPALFRVNAILAPQLTPFEDVRDALARDLLAGRAEAAIADRREAIADLLAGGATVEDLGAEAGMAVATAEVTADGPDDGIAADPAFRAAALAAAPGDFPELAELASGGLFALQVDDIAPPALRPLDEVRDAAAAAWQADETARRLAERGAELLAMIEAGTEMADLGLDPRTETGLTRGDIPAGAPPGLADSAFALPTGAASLVPGPPPALLRVIAITPPDPGDPLLAGLGQAIGQSGAQGQADDIARLYAEAMRQQAETRLDPGVIDAVNAQLR